MAIRRAARLRDSGWAASVCTLALAVCAAGCDPQVHRIAGADSEADAYDVVILGAGFDTDDELDAYRAAAYTLATGILASAPFSDHADHLRFWRIDVRSGPIDTSSCTTDCGHTTIVAPPPSAAPAPLETLNESGPEVCEEDLGATLCNGGPCNALWLDDGGMKEAMELATLVPDPDAVVVLANTQLPSGSGDQDPLSAGLAFVVAGVPMDASGAADGTNLLAHELGHALGLADEYTGASGESHGSVLEFPNVWQVDDPCYAPETLGSDGSIPKSAEDVPWSDLLDCEATLDPSLDCDSNGNTHDNACPRVLAAAGKTECLDRPGSISTKCLPYIGVYEGAYYATEGIYRPAYDCRMRTTSTDFCAVCTDILNRIFDSYP